MLHHCCSILLLAVATITAIPVEVEKSDIQTRDLAEIYRLPGGTIPTFYDIRLFIDPNNEAYFFGNTSIRILAAAATNQIVMHAYEMEIDSITITTATNTAVNIFSNYSLSNDDTQLLTIFTTIDLSVSIPYVVTINYRGFYAANMFGTYVSTYSLENGDSRKLVTTQMQPTFARRSFPCYDEPALKAIFRITIYAPAEFPIVVSNTEEVEPFAWPDVTGYVRHQFADSVVMSSYLVAYLVSAFENISNEGDMIFRTPFKVYSRPGTQAYAEFALDFGQKNLLALEEYTEIPYALTKMDKAAIPDFAAGAMENWGLITYREAALLVQDGVTTTSTRQNIGRIITHENMHQWFGNEVSPLWWNYLWLNEGFANFFENFGTDFVLPEWRMMDQFVLALQGVMQSDAVIGVNPMTTAVYTPSEVLGNFNSVAYQKSGSVIRMMQHFVTPEIFRKGLSYYLQHNLKSSATPTELYIGLEQAILEAEIYLPIAISSLMDTWTTQGGFPVLTITRQAPTGNSVTVRQERYFTDVTTSSNTRWYVPINWVLSTNPDFSDTTANEWLQPSAAALNMNVPGLSEAEWYIFNKQETGYYRVNYDVDNWVALSNLLNNGDFEQIHLLNRAQLIDDAFNLGRTQRLDYDIVFNLANYLVREKDYIPWGSANNGLSFMNNVLSGSDVYSLFQRFVLDLTEPLYSELGFIPSASEQHVTAFLRTIILNYNCRFGNSDCTNTAQELLRGFIANPNQSLHPDIQSVVYCSGLRNGDPDDFDFLWNRYLTTTDSTEQSVILSALGCTSNQEKLSSFLNQVISDDSQVREQDRHTVLVATINSGPDNANTAFDFIRAHFAEIQPRVQGLTGTTNILNALSSALNTEEHLLLLQDFMINYADVFSAGEVAATNAALETLRATRTWVNDNAEAVNRWLRTNIRSSAQSAVANFIAVFLSIVCLRFMH